MRSARFFGHPLDDERAGTFIDRMRGLLKRQTLDDGTA
jgi:hypothetical protein